MTDPSPYAPMTLRAAVFEKSASWPSVVVMLLALWFGFQIMFSAIFTVWAQSPHQIANPQIVDAFFLGSTPAAVLWNLAVFAIYAAIVLTLSRLMHGVGLAALIGPLRHASREFLRVSLNLLPIYALLTIPAIADPTSYQNMDVSAWLLLLPATLPLLFLQIGTEEVVFRGYLQSHLAALTRSRIVWIGVPSILFGLVHFNIEEPAYSAWLYVAWATCLGLVCADLTARSGTLGPALAVHFINNLGAILILSADEWLFGAALYVWPTDGVPWDPWITFEALFLFTVWLTARLALRR